MQTERRQDESPLDYHKRLIYGKLVDKTLADIDYTELSELVYGKPLSSDTARRMMYGSRLTLEMLDSENAERLSNPNVLSELDAKIVELKKERQKFFDQRAALNKVIRDRSREEELNEIIDRVVSTGELPRLEYQYISAPPSSNDLLVSLNDLHYGASYSNHWGSYNSEIARGMMYAYLDKIIEVAKTHQSENCICWENGDVISGSIHKSIQVKNKENVLEQIIGASELIAEFLAELSKHFRVVKFVSVAGNHSRIEPNKKDEIVEERLDNLIEWYLAARLQNFENIEIGAGDKIDPTMYVINIRGKNYGGVHGDFDGTVANIQSLQTMSGVNLYAVLSGHLHHNKIDTVQGIKLVMAGSFLGTDDYCIQRRIYGKQEQLICVCDASGIVCYYDVPLGNRQTERSN